MHQSAKKAMLEGVLLKHSCSFEKKKKKNSPYSIMLYGGQEFPVCLTGKLSREIFPKRLALTRESWNTHQVWPAVTETLN